MSKELYTVTVGGNFSDGCFRVDDTETPDYDAIIREFSDHGVEVSKKALEHNFFAWLSDFKSGYRCRRCFLFTPCGHNPLSFTAYTLNKGDKTYYA